MAISDYATTQLKMMGKFGPAVSSTLIEKRECALQELVKAGFATMRRNDTGKMHYSITYEGIVHLEHTSIAVK